MDFLAILHGSGALVNYVVLVGLSSHSRQRKKLIQRGGGGDVDEEKMG